MINKRSIPDRLLLFFEKIIKTMITKRMKQNVNTLKKRQQFIKELSAFLHNKFDLSDTQIFIFGSFLTDNFVPGESDIDIGIYSEDELKIWDIHYELDMYLNKIRLEHDIVDIEFNKKMLINIPIMVWGKTLTEYESEEIFNYLVDMIKKHGKEFGITFTTEN